ncbi:hypothetical protein RUM43_011799 [Polyplax serrata]|uniref:Uncharacterized protein n=1 Tax=Polyplax serrata TaxID=468196 RepID=A0AAN8PJT6_POLSC
MTTTRTTATTTTTTGTPGDYYNDEDCDDRSLGHHSLWCLLRRHYNGYHTELKGPVLTVEEKTTKGMFEGVFRVVQAPGK